MPTSPFSNHVMFTRLFFTIAKVTLNYPGIFLNQKIKNRNQLPFAETPLSWFYVIRNLQIKKKGLMVYRIQMEPVLGIETTFIRLRSISHGDKGRVPSNCREDLIKNFDKIGVMKSGKIEELGTYDELMDKRGLLYELAAGRK